MMHTDLRDWRISRQDLLSLLAVNAIFVLIVFLGNMNLATIGFGFWLESVVVAVMAGFRVYTFHLKEPDADKRRQFSTFLLFFPVKCGVFLYGLFAFFSLLVFPDAKIGSFAKEAQLSLSFWLMMVLFACGHGYDYVVNFRNENAQRQDEMTDDLIAEGFVRGGSILVCYMMILLLDLRQQSQLLIVFCCLHLVIDLFRAVSLTEAKPKKKKRKKKKKKSKNPPAANR